MMLPISCRHSRRVHSWNPGWEGLIAGRTFRAGLDKLLPVAFCARDTVDEEGPKAGRGWVFIDSHGLFAGFRVKLGGLLVPADETEKKPLPTIFGTPMCSTCNGEWPPGMENYETSLYFYKNPGDGNLTFTKMLISILYGTHANAEFIQPPKNTHNPVKSVSTFQNIPPYI
jgi:hypothetical protein